jgi:phospho-N-acetylmuramoyl-pentapeptide-transferase
MRLIVLSAGLAGLVSLLGTPLLIRLLRRHGYSQAIRQSTDDVKYPEHTAKVGTPSMGGLAIVAGIAIAYFGTHLLFWTPPTATGLLALYLTVGLAMVGMADDYLKIFKQRSTGIRARTKLLGQAFVALSFAWLASRFPDADGQTPASQAISLIRDFPWTLPLGLFLIWIWVLVTATTNAVNLTDGLDGLAAGMAVITFSAYLLVGVWEFNNQCVLEPPGVPCYTARDPLDLAIFAAACAGATFGFLWWNTSPASIFMGDTGSLAIGGAVAALAIMSRSELLLILLAGMYLVITISVILQVGSFKLTGKRVFRMAPLHHHFELLGWPEILIVVRFWIIHGLLVGTGLTVFYAEWVTA